MPRVSRWQEKEKKTMTQKKPKCCRDWKRIKTTKGTATEDVK